MKRPRSSTRNRITTDTEELQRLATGLAESGSMLEDEHWEQRLIERVDAMLRSGDDEDIHAALTELNTRDAAAHDQLADIVEARTESSSIEINGQIFDIILFAAPMLVWSRTSIPAGSIPKPLLQTLTTQLGAHIFGAQVRLGVADFLFGPDQLPHTICGAWKLAQQAVIPALKAEPMEIDTEGMPETSRFISDMRYIVGGAAVPRGEPLFRWNEEDGTREEALRAWREQGGPNMAALLPGCTWEMTQPDGFHSACRNADQLARPYSLRSSATFLQSILDMKGSDFSVIVATCFTHKLDEYRISFCPKNSNEVYHGVVWPMYGVSDENGEAPGEIENILNQCGITDVHFPDQHFPPEYCDDCMAPLYADKEGEMVHAELPAYLANQSLVLH